MITTTTWYPFHGFVFNSTESVCVHAQKNQLTALMPLTTLMPTFLHPGSIFVHIMTGLGTCSAVL